MPLRSMTGFGAAEGTVAGGRLRIEIRTVNHRHFSVQFRVPPELSVLEAEIREGLRRHFQRGHASVSARWIEEPTQAAEARVDTERARAVVEALRRLGSDLKVPGDLDLAAVARIPDVVRVVAGATPTDPVEVLAVIEEAARAVVRVREREGAALEGDLGARCRRLSDLAAAIESRSPDRLAAERDRLSRTVSELSGGIALDAARLAQEIALLASRLDITEELVRFRTHVAAIREAMGNGAAVGRELGFLLQELGREANTIGSKAGDAAIAGSVIAIKGELEKMREQVENLE